MYLQKHTLGKVEEFQKSFKLADVIFDGTRVERLVICNPWSFGLALGWEIVHVCGLVMFVPAAAYHFCLSLPATFSQPRTCIISQSRT